MADDKSKPGGQDRTRINVNEDYEVRDWSKKFEVSPEELKKAVSAVGNNAEDSQETPRSVLGPERTVLSFSSDHAKADRRAEVLKQNGFEVRSVTSPVQA